MGIQAKYQCELTGYGRNGKTTIRCTEDWAGDLALRDMTDGHTVILAAESIQDLIKWLSLCRDKRQQAQVES